MDFGNLMFDGSDAADPALVALPGAEFDFYSAFLPSQADAMGVQTGAVGLQQQHHQGHQQHHQHHQQQNQRQRQRQQQQGALQRQQINDDFEMDDDLAYLGEEDSSASGSALALPMATDALIDAPGAASAASASIVIGSGRSPYNHGSGSGYPHQHHHPYQLTAADAAAAAANPGTTILPPATASSTPGNLSPMMPPAFQRPLSSSPGDPHLLQPRVASKNRRSSGGGGGGNARTPTLPSNNSPRNGNNRKDNSHDDGHNDGHDDGVDATTTAAAAAANAKRLERRGHTKSRRGCYNCKRRRIKCQETRPACGHCLKTGLQCEYPLAPLVNHQPQHQIPLFSLQDMRFFQHFLLRCTLQPPPGPASLWTHEIPCLSHTHDYLMHALLGMAASDLMQYDASLVTAAMDHRLKAIRAIKRTLSAAPKWPTAGGSSSSSNGHSNNNGHGPTGTDGGDATGSVSPPPTHVGAIEPWDAPVAVLTSTNTASAPSTPTTPMFEEGNALMAACFALTFQSVALDDGLAEYMTFIRGIIVVALQMYLKGARILFRDLVGSDAQVDRADAAHDREVAVSPSVQTKKTNNNSNTTQQWSEAAAVTAVQRLAPLCDGDPVAETYHALVLEMAEGLLVSPVKAYTAMTRHYAWWMQLPYEQFRAVIDLDRPVFVLLASHWIALKQVLARVTTTTTTTTTVHTASGINIDTTIGRMMDEEEATEGNGSGSNRNPTKKKKTRSETAGEDHGMDAGVLRWLKHLNQQVEPEYGAYNEWPVWVEAALERDPVSGGE
ncbi:c6 zinc finger domain containing protein [Niveomyces insectorum RCEF 264]|uniref:C6 zinc finger domain containing protein n=1 Tax=Niveomyces insectorum RCEF 264 TaxID=1081102 RepID=A0A167ZRN5_9HYPO|nr:c6 zinc finger domain containing protein [Niveomyces insectorum RCEF 264]